MNKPESSPLVGLLKALLAHDSDEVQADAFHLYQELAPPPEEVLDTLKSRAAQLGPKSTEAAARYIAGLDLAGAPDSTRRQWIAKLIALIQAGQNEALGEPFSGWDRLSRFPRSENGSVVFPKCGAVC